MIRFLVRAAQQIGGRRPVQYVAWWRWRLGMTVVTRGRADRQIDIGLAADALRHPWPPSKINPERDDRTGRRGSRAVGGLRRRRVREHQVQSNHQPHAVSMAADG
jgi:hypothetical protein